MLSRSASLLVTLCLTLLSTSTLAQVFVWKGEGVCVDSANSQYDYLETTGIASADACQERCTSLDSTSLRGIEYEAASQGCLCLYENGAGFPANAFSEIGDDAGSGAVAGANATYATFQCYEFNGGSYSLVGTGGCTDSRGEFYAFSIPFNAQGTQTITTCQNACTASGTNGLVGLDYDGLCYCLYEAGYAPTVASTNAVSSNTGTGVVAGVSTFAGVTCNSYEIITPAPTPAPTPPPTLPIVTAGDRGGAVAVAPTVVVGKAPTIKAAKAPTLSNRGTKLSTGSGASTKEAKRRRRRY